MIKITESAQAEQARRLKIKTQEQRLVRLAVEGAGLSPWEAEELVEVVKEVFFSEPAEQPLRSGQLFYECVAATEGAGKALSQCQLVRVVLSVHEKEDRQIGARDGAEALRRHRILRLSEEAREQGGLLTQEDLAELLFCDARTIRRAIADLREKDIVVATRGQQNDIGPGVTHRAVAIRHWIEGMEPVEVARRINHSLSAVERYLQTFARVVFLQQKGFECFAMALTIGVSVAQVKTYLAILKEHDHSAEFERRAKEIEIIGGKFHEAQDFEKGGPSLQQRSKKGGNKR